MCPRAETLRAAPATPGCRPGWPHGQDSSFAREVHARLVRAAARANAELIVVDNRYQPKIDGDGQFKTSLDKVRRHLRQSKAKHVLVGAANDPSALGAVRAFQEAGRERTCAIAGQNAEPDARAELREPRTPFVASVAYFPERAVEVRKTR